MISATRTLSDEKLVVQVAETGSDAACDELFRRYGKKVYHWCHCHVHDMDEAVELTQEIFIKVFRTAGGFSGRSRFSTWLYRVVRNHCLNRLNSADHRRRLVQLSLDDHELPDAGLLEEIHQTEIRGELEQILDRAVGIMNPNELDAFVLHYRDGLTIKDVTRVLGCENVTGARTLIQNARRKFRRMIKTGGSKGE